MEHLMNCHGEWALLMQAAAALSALGLPGVALWLKSLRHHPEE